MFWIKGCRGEKGMNKKIQLSFRKGDWIAIGLVLVLALGVGALFLPEHPSSQEAVVQIYQNGALLRELPLSTQETIEISGDYHNTIVLKDGRAAITQSDCPGGDCVHSGWISQPGRSIVCLPNGLELRIVGKAAVDFVVG